MERINLIRYVEASALHPIDPRIMAAGRGTQVLLLTGQSSVESCQIPAPQRRFIQEVADGRVCLESGFPWLPGKKRARLCEPNIFAASWRNGWQFLHAQVNKRFQRGCVQLIAPILRHMGDPAVVIAGSCGYQILVHALNQQSEESKEILLVTLGAVGLSPIRSPRVQTFHVRGRWDLISRAGSIVRPDLIVDCGHMGYWEHPDVMRNVRERIRAFEG